MDKFSLKPPIFLLLAAFLVWSPLSADGVKSKGHNARMSGTWDATTGFFGRPVWAMFSFDGDGTLTEADNPGFDPNFGGDALSPGLGAWEKTSRITDNPVHTVDLYQTILDPADASNSVPPSVPFDSVSVENALHSNGKNSRKRNIAESSVPFSANGWFLNPAFFDFPPHDGQTLTDYEYKLINRNLLDDNAEPILGQNGPEQRVLEFYDIENDPYELFNLLDVGLSEMEQDRYDFLTNKLDQLTDGRTCADWSADVFGS